MRPNQWDAQAPDHKIDENDGGGDQRGPGRMGFIEKKQSWKQQDQPENGRKTE